MKLTPYPKYKPSGVEWLGDVPERWEIFHLKRHYIVVNGGTPLSTEDSYWDGGIHWITPEDLGKNRSKYIGRTRRTLSIEGLTKCGAELVPVNSIVLSTRAPIGYAAVTQRESCTNQGCRTLVPEGNRAYSDYLYYVLVASRPLLEAVGKGTTFMELSADLLGLHIVPFPPNSEQRAIADFLDREAAKIDALIDKKQTLIERLKEKRAALITRTVTRGLPPDAARAAGLEPEPKMRASGVEWLGDVPAHWEVLPLRRWYRVVNGGTPSSAEDAYWDGGINWITPEDLGKNRSKRIGNSRRTLSTKGLMNCGTQLVPINSIVLSTRAPIGHLAITSKKSCTNQGCRTLVPKGSCTYPDYLYYALLASRPLLEAVGKGTTFMELSAALLGSHIVPFPPDSEQRAIADFLDRETTKIDGLVTKVETAIARLREYRAALITAAVTGQVDVRGEGP